MGQQGVEPEQHVVPDEVCNATGYFTEPFEVSAIFLDELTADRLKGGDDAHCLRTDFAFAPLVRRQTPNVAATRLRPVGGGLIARSAPGNSSDASSQPTCDVLNLRLISSKGVVNLIKTKPSSETSTTPA